MFAVLRGSGGRDRSSQIGQGKIWIERLWIRPAQVVVASARPGLRTGSRSSDQQSVEMIDADLRPVNSPRISRAAASNSLFVRKARLVFIASRFCTFAYPRAGEMHHAEMNAPTSVVSSFQEAR
jgi:hypothetical protein